MTRPEVDRRCILALGAVSTGAALVYGLGYVLTLPAVTPEMLLRGSFASVQLSRTFAISQVASVLVFASALLPVLICFTVRRYSLSPAGMAVGASGMGVALLMEIFNSLPTLALQLYPAPLVPVPASLAAYQQQTNWIRFLSFDVTAFVLIFAAGLWYAFLLRKESRLWAGCMLGSIVIFLLHLPFLWIAPRVAVALMGLSVCACAPLPYLMARWAVPAPGLVPTDEAPVPAN